jgi:membrane glycosyltransferase
LFSTPEETAPSADLMVLRNELRQAGADERTALIPDAIADPYVNALHVWLLHTAQAAPSTKKSIEALSKNQPSLDKLRQKALNEGINALTVKERLYLLSDLESMRRLHRDFWTSPFDQLADQWRKLYAA